MTPGSPDASRGQVDAGLATWCTTTSDPDHDDGNDEVATALALRGLAGVSAAYVRPDAEPA